MIITAALIMFLEINKPFPLHYSVINIILPISSVCAHPTVIMFI